MALLFSALLFVLPGGLDSDDVVDLGETAHYYGLEVPADVGQEDEVAVTVHYRTDAAFDEDVHVFLHVQGQESACRIIRDERPTPDADGWIAHDFLITVPNTPACEPQRLEIYTGLYNRRGGGRFRVRGTSTTDDRIHAGYFDVVQGESSSPHAIAPSAMEWQKTLSLANPFRWWLLGLLCSILLTLGLGFWLRKGTGAEAGPSEPPVETVPAAPGAEETPAAGLHPVSGQTGSPTASGTPSEPPVETEDGNDDDPYAEDEDDDGES